MTNLLEFLEKATTVIDEGKTFDVVYLDFAKAIKCQERDCWQSCMPMESEVSCSIGFENGSLEGGRELC